MLMRSDEAMELLSEASPKVRLYGDSIAHGYAPAEWYLSAVNRSSDKRALSGLLEYIRAAPK